MTSKSTKVTCLRFEVTTRCPLKCAHCHVGAEEEGENLDFESFLRTVRSAPQLGIDRVRFSGGDPSMWPTLLDAIIECRRLELGVAVNTIAPALMRKLGTVAQEFGAIKLTTTLNAPSRQEHDRIVGVPGHIEAVLDALTAIKGSIAVDVNYPLLRENLKGVTQARALLADYGVGKLCLNRMYPAGRAQKNRIVLPNRNELANLIETVLQDPTSKEPPRITFANAIPLCIVEDPQSFLDFNSGPLCKHGRESLSISATGHPRLCVALPSYQESIVDTPIEEFLDSPEMKAWHQDHYLPAECRACEFVSICRGGCRLAAQESTGKLDGHDPLSMYADSNYRSTSYNKESPQR